MGRVYAVVNQKGGVGKTTTTVNVAAALALAGRRTLVIDLDPQANATSGLGIEKYPAGGRQKSTYDLLIGGASLEEATVSTPIVNLFLAPANLDLAGAEPELIVRENNEETLRAALADVRDRFDVVLIDSPPSLGLLTVNALAAADSAIIPIQCEYYALEGASQLLRTVELVRRRLNPVLEIGPVILTMYDNRVRLNQQVVEDVRKAFRERVSLTIVPRNVRLAEAPSFGMPAVVYDPRSRGAIAYREIAQEMLKNGKKRAG